MRSRKRILSDLQKLLDTRREIRVTLDERLENRRIGEPDIKGLSIEDMNRRRLNPIATEVRRLIRELLNQIPGLTEEGRLSIEACTLCLTFDFAEPTKLANFLLRKAMDASDAGRISEFEVECFLLLARATVNYPHRSGLIEKYIDWGNQLIASLPSVNEEIVDEVINLQGRTMTIRN